MSLEHTPASRSNPAAVTNTIAGIEQAIKKYLLVSADYFWKYTDNAFDFDTLFNTPITVSDLLAEVQDRRRIGAHRTPDMHGFQPS